MLGLHADQHATASGVLAITTRSPRVLSSPHDANTLPHLRASAPPVCRSTEPQRARLLRGLPSARQEQAQRHPATCRAHPACLPAMRRSVHTETRRCGDLLEPLSSTRVAGSRASACLTTFGQLSEG